MAGLVQVLKKGNQTLTKKVSDLEESNNQLREENGNLRLENYELRKQLEYVERRKVSREDEMFNFFTGMYSKVLNSIDIEKLK